MRFFLFFIVITLSFVSCGSEFNKALNSDDYELKYNTANRYYDEGKFELSKQLYDQVRGYYRSSKEFEDILFRYAYSNYNLDQFVLAGHYFTQFASTYRQSENVEEAAFMAAMSDYKMSGSFRLDQGSNSEAIDKFQDFINTYPKSERLARCNGLMDELQYKMELKSKESADLYLKTRQYQAAMHSYSNFLKEYPASKEVENVRYSLVKSSYELARESVLKKQGERLENTIEYCSIFTKKFPDSEYSKEVLDIEGTSNQKLKILRDNVRY